MSVSGHNSRNYSVGIAIPTCNAEEFLAKQLSYLLKFQTGNLVKIVIFDSNSTDGTKAIASKFEVEVVDIDPCTFNHRASRELARQYLNTDIVVFLTQDAIPASNNTINTLIEPLLENKAAIAYARQLPRGNASLFESFPRQFNYPPRSMLRDISMVKKYGVYTFFCSNSCTAWSNKALDEIKGFKRTLTSEDYFACAELLLKGHKVAYVSEAQIFHSHKYSLKEEFQRAFDIGYVRGERLWVQEAVGDAEKRGREYFIELLKIAWKYDKKLIPYAFLQTTIKYIGYKVGFKSLRIPKSLKFFLSSQKYFWH